MFITSVLMRVDLKENDKFSEKIIKLVLKRLTVIEPNKKIMLVV